jgi:adenylate kinase family enzyme
VEPRSQDLPRPPVGDPAMVPGGREPGQPGTDGSAADEIGRGRHRPRRQTDEVGQPASQRHLAVVGNSGSGKTTLARQVAEDLGLAHVELDALFHQPGWTPLEPDEFGRRVEAALDRADRAEQGWVVCGNYSAVQDAVWARADTVVWLDLPRWRVMARVSRRTLRRVVRREELWNGNREPWQNLYAWAPERNIMRWSWTRHEVYVRRYATAMDDPRWSDLTFVRLRSPAQVDAWRRAQVRSA